MNILHYTIGLPPRRNGGAPKYAYALIEEQSKTNNVYCLICGDTLSFHKRMRIEPLNSKFSFKCYKLTSPITPPMTFGIKNPNKVLFHKSVDELNVNKFIVDNNIEVLHLHTLMGISRELVEYIHSLGVKIVLTTHDFYGICAKAVLLDRNDEICNNPCDENCSLCNLYSPSDLFMRVCNSGLYYWIKSKIPFKSRIANQIISQSKKNSSAIIKEKNNYKHFFSYYNDMFDCVDLFLFNSEQTKEVYSRYLNIKKGLVIPVTSRLVRDKRKKKVIDASCIRIAYIGTTRHIKGYPVLKDALLNLYKKGIQNWKLSIWDPEYAGIDPDCELITHKGGYEPRDIESVYDKTDLLVVPSTWYETFSLVTLEALSYGVPVLVSNTVGARNIIEKIDSSFIVKKTEWGDKLTQILEHPNILETYNKKIIQLEWNYSIEQHTEQIIKSYKKLLGYGKNS